MQTEGWELTSYRVGDLLGLGFWEYSRKNSRRRNKTKSSSSRIGHHYSIGPTTFSQSSLLSLRACCHGTLFISESLAPIRELFGKIPLELFYVPTVLLHFDSPTLLTMVVDIFVPAVRLKSSVSCRILETFVAWLATEEDRCTAQRFHPGCAGNRQSSQEMVG